MEKRRLLFLGDIHGKFSIIEKCIGQYDLKNSDIIQLGDFGIGFNEKLEMKILSDLDIYLSYKDIVILLRATKQKANIQTRKSLSLYAGNRLSRILNVLRKKQVLK